MSVSAQNLRRKAPGWTSALLAVALGFQIALAAVQPDPMARAALLPPGPSAASAAWMQTFDRLPAAHMLDLYLQTFDNQPGISIPYLDLDYARVAQWLRAALRLDPVSQYPLLMAAQLYAQVPDPARQRFMLEFVYEQYLLDPERRWRWLAHAVIMAKHRVRDLDLALKYAHAIAEHSPHAPSWARQMHIFLLEDMGEFEAARVLLGGLLAEGLVTDRHEQLLLQESLERIQAAGKSAAPTKRRRTDPPSTP